MKPELKAVKNCPFQINRVHFVFFLKISPFCSCFYHFIKTSEEFSRLSLGAVELIIACSVSSPNTQQSQHIK